MRVKLSLAALALVAAFAAPALAHHSHGNYQDTFTDISGTVKEVHLLLPHSWIYLEVKDPKGGEPTTWALEATGPMGIFHNGVTKEDVKGGDKIKARCHLLRDGSHGCLLGFVTPEHGDKSRGDGVEKQWD